MVLMDESAQSVTATDDRPERPFGGQSGITPLDALDVMSVIGRPVC